MNKRRFAGKLRAGETAFRQGVASEGKVSNVLGSISTGHEVCSRELGEKQGEGRERGKGGQVG